MGLIKWDSRFGGNKAFVNHSASGKSNTGMFTDVYKCRFLWWTNEWMKPDLSSMNESYVCELSDVYVWIIMYNHLFYINLTAYFFDYFDTIFRFCSLGNYTFINDFSFNVYFPICFCYYLFIAISQWDCWRSACLLPRSSSGTGAPVRPSCNRTSRILLWSENLTRIEPLTVNCSLLSEWIWFSFLFCAVFFLTGWLKCMQQ